MAKAAQKPSAPSVEDPRGLKRICLSCSTRFYDLNKRPIECPNCQTEYTGEYNVKGQKSKVDTPKAEIPKKAEAVTKDVAETEDEEDDTVVSLNDLEDDDEEDSEDTTDPDLEALKEIGEDLDDTDLDDEDDIDATLEEEDK